MIVNPDELPALQREWDGVVRMRGHIRHLVLATFACDMMQSPTLGDVLYNLPLILAFEVLMKVLLLARDQGHFDCSGIHLGELMDNAKTALPWMDWQCLRDGVIRRDEVAQNGKLFGDLHCLLYIAYIEQQLVAWGITPVTETYIRARSMSFSPGP